MTELAIRQQISVSKSDQKLIHSISLSLSLSLLRTAARTLSLTHTHTQTLSEEWTIETTFVADVCISIYVLAQSFPYSKGSNENTCMEISSLLFIKSVIKLFFIWWHQTAHSKYIFWPLARPNRHLLRIFFETWVFGIDVPQKNFSPFCPASPDIIGVKVCNRQTDRQTGGKIN